MVVNIVSLIRVKTKMHLTKKIQIYPSKDNKDKLWNVSVLCTELWNACIEQRRDHKARGLIGKYSQQNELPEIKKQIPEFKIPSSQVLQNVTHRVTRGYQTFFELRKNGDMSTRTPGFKASKFFFTQEYSQNGSSFIVEEGVLKLAYGKSRKDWMRFELVTEIPSTNIKTVQIKHDKDSNKYYACLTYYVENTPKKENGHVIYFDPGCKTTLTGIKTDGTFVSYDINPLRKINMDTYKAIDDMKSSYDRLKNKRSKAAKRLKRRIKKYFSKINTRTKSHLHTLANKILNDHEDVKEIKIGDWSKKETLADTGSKFLNKRINRAVQNNNPLQKLIGYLSYKAELRGQSVSKFDERGTTRTCSKCGHIHKEGINPSKRVFECESCGFRFSRDYHSCLNFLKKYESALWQGFSGNLPDRSREWTLSLFACKPKLAEKSLEIS